MREVQQKKHPTYLYAHCLAAKNISYIKQISTQKSKIEKTHSRILLFKFNIGLYTFYFQLIYKLILTYNFLFIFLNFVKNSFFKYL